MKMAKSEFLETFVSILKNARYDNTYKMAWAKALVEISMDYDQSHMDDINIPLREMAARMLKYYFNQSAFFNLQQGSNPKKSPELITLAHKLIYQFNASKTNKPIRYERIESSLKDTKTYEQCLNKATSVVKQDVSHRFLNLNGQTMTKIYHYQKGENHLIIKRTNLLTLKDFAYMLLDIINYRWSLILENFNASPRIGKKVRINDDETIRRKPLNKYFKYIEMDNPEHTCFICGDKINRSDITIDHVIPWSYMYADDLWNLVFVHKSCNSQKSDTLPDEETIKKLEKRNLRLQNALYTQGRTNKPYHSILMANEDNLARKFWIGIQ